MKITIETNLPLYGEHIVCLSDDYGMILVPDVTDNNGTILEVLKEALQEEEGPHFLSWVGNHIYVNKTGRWYVYLPQNLNRESCSLLVQPYNDSSESYIVAQGSYDELDRMRKTNPDPEYQDGDILFGVHTVAKCYATEHKFKAEEYLILS